MPELSLTKWNWLKFAWNAFGGITAIIGVAGIPDDMRKWGEGFNFLATLLGHEAIRWILFVVGMSIVAVVNLLPRFRGVSHGQRPTTPSQPNPKAGVSPLPVPRITPASIGDMMLFRQMVRAGKIGSANPADSLPPFTCPICSGNGNSWGVYEGVCTKCGGTGELPGELAQFPKCRVCGGNGHDSGVYEEICKTCNGFGVRIPDLRYQRS